ncbi:MAG: lyase family protein [Candidatus Woesearchaeota archaeon]
MNEYLNLVSKLSEEDKSDLKLRLRNISPDDGKYFKSANPLRNYLTPEAEWNACILVQKTLLETRIQFDHICDSTRGNSKSTINHLLEFEEAEKKIDILNISLLEDHPSIRHDQLSVLHEIGRNSSEDLESLLHPGTTSYDILDTARSYLFKKAWKEVIRPEIVSTITALAGLSERSKEILQVGRTHLQNTSPVTVGLDFSRYSARLSNRVNLLDNYFDDLRGKISGIVGTGASIDMVIGEGTSILFEKRVLEKLEKVGGIKLKPDYTATQVVQKERLADVGHGLTTLMYVLADFAEDVRKYYSSAIGEMTSRDNAERLGGSSADAMKNNPIDYENISGKAAIVESGMRILYEMIETDFHRDLRSSVQARYQPQSMMTQVYESILRLNKALKQLSLNEDKIAENLAPIRDNPSEALVAILRGEAWKHPVYGVGHDFVKEMGKRAKKQKKNLLEVCFMDDKFAELYANLSENKQKILSGELEKYLGSTQQRIEINLNDSKNALLYS